MPLWSQPWAGLRRRLGLTRRRHWIRARFRQLVPAPVLTVLDVLTSHGFSAHLVGGSVRDLFLGRRPEDWDVATSALPREVRKAFRRTHPTGLRHGTVTVMSGDMPLEVTTYRVEGEYADFRHPDQVAFTSDIVQDLARRDITFNAMALSPDGALVDPFGGLADLSEGIIRAVGDPERRFREDALRLLRVVRFSAQLGFDLDPATLAAVREHAPLLVHIASERIRDELTRILLSDRPGQGVKALHETGLLAQFWPELEEGVGFEQNPHHAYTVFEHSIRALEASPRTLCLRLAALLHDVAKPRCMTVDGEGQRRFFYHEQVGARVAEQMMKRLKFDRATVDRATHLIRYHMALHHYPDMTDAAIRRLIRRVGPESIDDLVALRRADRWASGTKKAPLSRGARRLLRRMDQIRSEDSAFSLKDLAVDGHDVMTVGGVRPGPLVGKILEHLMELVLDDPQLNTREALETEIRRFVLGDDEGRAVEDEPDES